MKSAAAGTPSTSSAAYFESQRARPSTVDASAYAAFRRDAELPATGRGPGRPTTPTSKNHRAAFDTFDDDWDTRQRRRDEDAARLAAQRAEDILTNDAVLEARRRTAPPAKKSVSFAPEQARRRTIPPAGVRNGHPSSPLEATG